MEEEKFPMCARRVCKCTNIYQEDLYIRELVTTAWNKGYFISGFYEENNVLYMFWPRDLKHLFWDLPENFEKPFYIDFNKKMNEINLFWLINYYPDKDPEPQPFCKDESLLNRE